MYSIPRMIPLLPYRLAHSAEHRAKAHRTLFALPPSLLRNIIQRSQPIQTATINPTTPATAIPLPNETLGE